MVNPRCPKTLARRAARANPLASALLSYFAEHEHYDGTATHVLRMLEEWTPAWDRRDGLWPRSARALSSQLRKMSPALRALGVSVTFERVSGIQRTRTITLTRLLSSRAATSCVLDPSRG